MTEVNALQAELGSTRLAAGEKTVARIKQCAAVRGSAELQRLIVERHHVTIERRQIVVVADCRLGARLDEAAFRARTGGRHFWSGVFSGSRPFARCGRNAWRGSRHQRHCGARRRFGCSWLDLRWFDDRVGHHRHTRRRCGKGRGDRIARQTLALLGFDISTRVDRCAWRIARHHGRLHQQDRHQPEQRKGSGDPSPRQFAEP